MADGFSPSEAQLIARVERLERQVRMLAERTGIGIEDPADGVDPEVVALAREGKRMHAAKLYSERTGADFATAQRVINGLGL
jgi:ribosomal protein S12 methylthiotransferase accessory factor YcaO